MRLDGHEVAGLHGRAPGRSAAGPPAWASYVSVADADATCRRAAALGATVLMEPFDAPGTARIGAIADPQGAVLGVWQPGDRIGATRVNDPGAMCMNQLATPDPEAAARFYGDLFGWAADQVSPPPVPYWSITNAGRLNAGMMPLPPGGMPPCWSVYFTATGDLHEAAAALESLGGAVVVPVTRVPAGAFLVARDPQGASVSLFAGATDP